MRGKLGQYRDHWQMTEPELIPKRWIGYCRPNYKSLGRRMGANLVRDRVLQILRNELDEAGRQIECMLEGVASTDQILRAIGAPADVESFPRLFTRVHYPKTPETGVLAVQAMERFAALVALKRLRDDSGRNVVTRNPLQLDVGRRLAQWSVKPTASQRDALAHLARIFSTDRVDQALLSGDVGTGKTKTYATLAAAVADAGGRVAILLPSGPLATQVHQECLTQFPDIPCGLVTTSTRSQGSETALAVGTTALLARDHGTFDLVICDEQQKLGVEQRQLLRDPQTHLLEVTATAIPRTLALARYGLIHSVHLREGHAARHITTTIWKADEVMAAHGALARNPDDGRSRIGDLSGCCR